MPLALVTLIEPGFVHAAGWRIPTETVIWAALRSSHLGGGSAKGDAAAVATVRNMATSAQERVALADVPARLADGMEGESRGDD